MLSPILKTLETSSSLGMFARDTGGCLISRLGLARSKDEAKEIALSESSESALFYFSAPLFTKASANILSKTNNLDKKYLLSDITSLKNINSDLLKKIKLLKLGQLVSTFGIILPFTYLVPHIKNYTTFLKNGKNKFTSVIGLEKDKNTSDKSKEKEKIQKTVKSSLKAGLITLLAGFAGLGILKKNNALYNKIEPVMDNILRRFDFSEKCDLKKIHYGALIYPVSILSYLKASRDKYEKKENIRRFSVTVPLLFFGEKLIQNPIYKHFDKKFKTNVFNQGNILSYKEIDNLKNINTGNYIKSKNRAFGITLLINTILIAAAVSLLNRIKTGKDYKKAA